MGDNNSGERLAATVMLVRDGAQGLETLMMQRPRRGSFADAWVWPGGAVDAEDFADTDAATASDISITSVPAEAAALPQELLATRNAAGRELHEETGMRATGLVPYALWSPPGDTSPKFRTWFYAASEFSGVPVPHELEVAALEWVCPREMLAAHARDEITLVVPTWVTLWQLEQLGSVERVVQRAQTGPFELYATYYEREEQVFYWSGDTLHGDCGIHRLETASRPWRYRREE